MSVPKYNELYNPTLAVLLDEQVRKRNEIYSLVAKKINLSEQDLAEVLSSGQTKFVNRAGWAITYLKKAGLIETVSRGIYKITSVGKKAVAEYSTIDNQVLSQYQTFRDFIKKSNVQSFEPNREIPSDNTPQELLDKAYEDINNALAEELLGEIVKKNAGFFEKLVVKLLLKMGYGGTLADAGQVTQASNDGGIDGIIKEDKLGFSQIYVQAKRWDINSVIGRPEIQKFAGALLDTGTKKGLFITTAHFSTNAVEFANRQHIVLIDGQKLAKLMIEYDIGVSTSVSYHLKNLDTDFFNDDESF